MKSMPSILSAPKKETVPDWNRWYAARAGRLRSSAIRELLKVISQPGMISFAGGMPAPESFPLSAFREACEKVLAREGPAALQYSATEGYGPLREFVAGSLRTKGIPCQVENVLMTSGSQQALDLIGKVFVDGSRPACVERPTYLGALQAWDSYAAEYITVPLDDEGIVLEGVPELLERSRPRFMYVLPNFHNPAGVSLSLARRRRLVEILASAECFLLEDDPYAELCFEGGMLPPLASLMPERTLYLGTFSKILAPGIRLGYVAGPQEVIRKLVQAKQGVDLHTSTFDQMVACEVGRMGILPAHIGTVRDIYRERCAAMLTAMESHFPDAVRRTRPKGGLFLWATLPEPLDSVELLSQAIAAGVAYVPGPSFYPPGMDEARRHLRLNFSYCGPERIEEGIRRLGAVFTRAMQ
ncbi:MAG: 2-aminoadipate transaminase [Acidobacteria bacterium]|nr:2-aminoadipate transaminase [Acidobacteriota bacterium]